MFVNRMCVPPSVNPARAGMIPKMGLPQWVREGKPRASGDDPHCHRTGSWQAA